MYHLLSPQFYILMAKKARKKHRISGANERNLCAYYSTETE